MRFPPRHWRHIVHIVIALCGGFLAACTASSQPAFRPPIPVQTQSQDCEDLYIQFSVSYSQDGTPTYRASIRDQADQPPTTITRVLFAFTALPAPGKAVGSTTTLTARPTGDARYASTGGFRLTPGSWQVEVIVRQQALQEAPQQAPLAASPVAPFAPASAPPTQVLCAFRLNV